MNSSNLELQVSSIRAFNRFFTRQIGLLRESLLHSSFSLTECRILFELSNKDSLTASDLCNELGLDAGYLSRILSKLTSQNLIKKKDPTLMVVSGSSV